MNRVNALKKTLFVVVFLLATGLFAQTKGTTESQNPSVSPDDLKKATDDIKKTMQESLRNAEEKAAEERRLNEESDKREREDAQKKAESAISSFKSDIGAKVDAVSEKQTRAIDLGQKVVIGVIFFLVLAGIILFLLAPRKNKMSELLTNPSIIDLKTFSAEHGNKKRIGCTFVLSDMGTEFDGMRFEHCVVELRENKLPLVYIRGEEDPVVWDRRFQTMARIAGENKRIQTART